MNFIVFICVILTPQQVEHTASTAHVCILPSLHILSKVFPFAFFQCVEALHLIII